MFLIMKVSSRLIALEFDFSLNMWGLHRSGSYKYVIAVVSIGSTIETDSGRSVAWDWNWLIRV